MNDLENILDNIEEYSQNVDGLVMALKYAGVKDFEEFKKVISENHISIKKTVQDQIEEKFNVSEEADWEEAKRLNTEEAYQNYLNLYPYGNFREEARERKNKLKEKKEKEACDNAWYDVDKEDADKIKSFIETYPNCTHVNEAKECLKKLEKKEEGIQSLLNRIDELINKNKDDKIVEEIKKSIKNGNCKVEDLLDAIKEDNNILNSYLAHRLWYDKVITDFSRTEIDDDFISLIKKDALSKTVFPDVAPLSQVSKSPCTEVYFWGIPSSGKSCALGAILSSAKSGKVARSMQQDPNCQGYGYMTRLANIFKSKGSVGILPGGTPVSSTYEMGFDLEDEDGKMHPITCIDLAGELVACMYQKNAKEQLDNEQESVLKTLTDVLVDNKTDNKKIHFFVIEYGAEDKLYRGLTQRDYLDAAAAYIQSTGIFKKDTVGVYILITKVDKVKFESGSLKDELRTYMKDNYKGFYNILERICKDNDINGGKVAIQPFSLGKVCFRDYCKFNDMYAVEVVRIIMGRAYGSKNNLFQKIVNWLKK